MTVALITDTVEEQRKTISLPSFFFLPPSQSDPTTPRARHTPQPWRASPALTASPARSSLCGAALSPPPLSPTAAARQPCPSQPSEPPHPLSGQAAGLGAGSRDAGPSSAQAFPLHSPAAAGQGHGAAPARPRAAFRARSHAGRGERRKSSRKQLRSQRCPSEPCARPGGGEARARRDTAVAPSSPPGGEGQARGGDSLRRPRNSALLLSLGARAELRPPTPPRGPLGAGGAPEPPRRPPCCAVPGASHLGGHGAAAAGSAAALPSPPRPAAARSPRPARPPPLGRAGGSTSPPPVAAAAWGPLGGSAAGPALGGRRLVWRRSRALSPQPLHSFAARGGSGGTALPPLSPRGLGGRASYRGGAAPDRPRGRAGPLCPGPAAPLRFGWVLPVIPFPGAGRLRGCGVPHGVDDADSTAPAVRGH